MIVGALSKPLRFLELPEVLTIHESSIDQFGGAYGVRDQGLLDSAINMPRQAFGGDFAHTVPFGMAAAYAFHICKNHPFVDGNKRTALGAMVVFLRLNGWTLNADEMDAANRILALAEGTLDKESLSQWIEAAARARPTIELREFFAAVDGRMFQERLSALSTSGKDGFLTSSQEAVAVLPLLSDFVHEAALHIASGREVPAYLLGQVNLLTALYRIAEDMGYEW